MQYRVFGRTGWRVSEVGYGMWGMAGWTGSDDEESFASLDRAIALGCNFFDTAWAYGDGHSERLLGATLKRHRGKQLYIATKIPPKNRRWPATPRYAPASPARRRSPASRSAARPGHERFSLEPERGAHPPLSARMAREIRR